MSKDPTSSEQCYQLEKEIEKLEIIKANIKAHGIITVQKDFSVSKAFMEELAFVNRHLEDEAVSQLDQLVKAKKEVISNLQK